MNVKPSKPPTAQTPVDSRCSAAVALILLLYAAASTAGDEPDPRLEQSRAIVAAFAAELQAELQSALAAGGTASAIGVCSDAAPALASRLSREHGARVSRTSLRFRNPANLPTDWQKRVLADFDTRAESGDKQAMEFFRALPDGGARYMKAIPTGGVCLACHGSEFAADVADRLAENYPHDRARGYAPGDIRGAFSIVWPGPAEPAGQQPRR